jgi:hypothetical protein
MEHFKEMNTESRSLNELPIHPRSTLIPTPLDAAFVPAIPAIKPMELWAFLENSDFVRHKNDSLYRQDEVQLIRHDEFLETDYELLVEAGCVGVRDAAWWYISHPAPGTFNWTWLDRVVTAAEKHSLKLYLDLWHYGYPDWLDMLSPDAPMHFADFARQIAQRYPSLEYYCICNEPSLLVEMGGRQGQWAPFLREENPSAFRRQVSRMIIEASKAILDVKPDAVLIIPEPWHATDRIPENDQAAVLDTVLGLRDPELGGCSDLVTIIGLNHYRDSTLPPFHRLLINAQSRWPAKQLWVTETSGPPTGWQQAEWFWWMLAETRLAAMSGVNVAVFTWAPAISMYDWDDEKLQLHNGIWIIDEDGRRLPNGKVLQAVKLARQYGYLF